MDIRKVDHWDLVDFLASVFFAGCALSGFASNPDGTTEGDVKAAWKTSDAMMDEVHDRLDRIAADQEQQGGTQHGSK